jgi:hypothetical protein
MVAVLNKNNHEENIIMIKPNFDQSTRSDMKRFTYKLIEILEDDSKANQVTDRHLMGLFYLQRSLQFSENKVEMVKCINTAYIYIKELHISTDQLESATTLLTNGNEPKD